MILVDSNQIFISHLIINKIISQEEISLSSVREECLKLLIKIKKKFTDDYGQIILAFDDRHCWRKEIFPFYKKNRKKERKTSQYDWDKLFSIIDIIMNEFRSGLPFKVIQANGAEADDIIAVVCRNHLINQSSDPILILSADKDFIQLHRYRNVKQFDPVKNKWITHDDPNLYLREHIIRGDKSDGIPNILTADNVLAEGKNQKIMSKAKILDLANTSPDDFTNFVRTKNWQRNSQLIDLSKIPVEICRLVSTTVSKYIMATEFDTKEYLEKFQLNYLIEDLI